CDPGMSNRAAKAAERPAPREPTAWIRWRVWRCTDPTNRSAIQPVPRIPQRNVGTAAASGVRAVGSTAGKGGISQVAGCGGTDGSGVVERLPGRALLGMIAGDSLVPSARLPRALSNVIIRWPRFFDRYSARPQVYSVPNRLPQPTR